MQLQNQLMQQQAAATPDAAAIATLEADIAAHQATIETLTAAATKCDTDCQTNFDAQVAACVADCKPCSYEPHPILHGRQNRGIRRYARCTSPSTA